MIAGNSLWHLVKQTDAISKFVLLLLLVMSIAIWTVFLCRAILFYRKRRDFHDALQALKGAHTVSDIAAVSQRKAGTVPGYFIATLVPSIVEALEQQQINIQLSARADKFSGVYSDTKEQAVMAVREACDQEIDTIILWEQQSVPLISTSAVISPLLGLLGTVWGLIHAFMGISETQVADIATVAPGIAEALTTTLAGLIVAIPAVVMVNYMTVQIGHLEQQLVKISDHMMRVMQRAIIQKKGELCVDLAAAGEQKEIQR
jgi:biopolymer transport protein ExbB/TolQ